MKKGETLLSEKPYVCVLKSSLRTEKCNQCFSSIDLKKCSKCHYVYYCSKNCQKSAWSLHKLECNKLAKIMPKILPDSAHMLIRLLLRLKTDKHVDFSSNSNAKERNFSHLMSHIDEIKEDKRRMEHFHSLLMILNVFFDNEETLNKTQILEIFGKMCINSFNILDNDMNSIGTGIYLAASIVDHSCEPNTVAIFEGTTLHLRSIRNLPDFQWEKVRISYIDVLSSTSQRKQELQSMYYFLCECARCYDKEEDKVINSMACSNKNCTGFVSFSEKPLDIRRCVTCHAIMSKDRIRKFEEVTQLSDYHLLNMKNKDMAYIDVCESILSKQNNLLYDLNIRKIKILDLAFEACIQLERWNDAIRYGERLLPGYRKYYRKYHPLIGLLNMKLLKLTLLQDNIIAAKSYYEEAKEILLITHGSNHLLFSSLQEIFCL